MGTIRAIVASIGSLQCNGWYDIFQSRCPTSTVRQACTFPHGTRRNTMFSNPLESDVGFAAIDVAADLTDSILPEEISLAHAMRNVKRRRQFLAGRAAARRACRTIGLGLDLPLLPTHSGAPSWPSGTVGSISHSGDFAVAVVGSDSDVNGLGIDLEYMDGRSRLHLIDRICNLNERRWVEEIPDEAERRFRILFSAKESVYKALRPTIGRYFGFDAVSISPLDDDLRVTMVENLHPLIPPGTELVARVRVLGAYVMTAVRR